MDDDKKSPVLSIPPEIRGHIFNLLGSIDSTNCRLVSHQFLQDIDEWVDFQVSLDETNGHLPRVLNLRLSSITIMNLEGPPPSTGITGTRLLLHPNLLRELNLPHKAKVSMDNLHYLLVDSANSIETLDLSLSPPMSTLSTQGPLRKYKFPSLKSLSLSLSTLAMPSAEEPFRPSGVLKEDSFLFFILNAEMDKLSSLKIQIRCLGYRQVSQLSTVVLRMISEHFGSLKTLDFDMIQGHGVPSSEERPLTDSDLERLDLNLLNKVSLKEVRIVNSTAIGISCWAQLLANQNKLSYIETDILPAPCALFLQLIHKNSSTLTELDIGDLTLDPLDPDDPSSLETRPFDIAIFAQCSLLKKLTLDRNSTKQRPNFIANSPDLINLFSLPESLEELNINYFLLSSDELLILIGSEEEGLGSSLRLKSISLTQCGDTGDFGVDGSVLQKILTLPRIEFLEISPLNFSQEEEADKLNLILKTFGYPQGHSYFQLSRVKDYQVGMDDFFP